jgi:hypothetical protein
MNQELIAALRKGSVGLDDPNLAHAIAQGDPIQVADLQDDAQSPLNEIILRAGFRARLVAPLIHGASSACWWCAAARRAHFRPIPST